MFIALGGILITIIKGDDKVYIDNNGLTIMVRLTRNLFQWVCDWDSSPFILAKNSIYSSFIQHGAPQPIT